jgi:thioredoxin 1
LADKHSEKGQLAFAKVNVDHVNNVAGRYSVSAMPTFVFFQNGAVQGPAVDSIKGRQSVNLGEKGVVERIRGADPVALEAAVEALSEKVVRTVGREQDESTGKE